MHGRCRRDKIANSSAARRLSALMAQISQYFAENRLSVSPSMPCGALVAGRKEMPAAAFPFDRQGVVLTFCGSGAIYQAARLLSLSAADNVLCPAYNCGHEIEPFLRNKAAVKLYSVCDDLRADVAHIAQLIDRNTRAVLVTHYFGFPQPMEQIRKLCDLHDLVLVEDCAHSLFSRDGARPLGTTGDLAIFSVRKTLPIPNGGALLVNSPRLRLEVDLTWPPAVATWSKVLDLWVSSLKRPAAVGARSATSIALLVIALPLFVVRKLARRLRVLDPLCWLDPDNEDFAVDNTVYSWRMACVSQRIVRNITPDAVISRRRENYEYLLNALQGIDGLRPIFQTLPDGVCPLYLPVFVEQPERLLEVLGRKRMGAIRWWGSFHPAVNWEAFPRESHYKRHIVALPVHQDLSRRQLRQLADAIRVDWQQDTGATGPVIGN